MGRIYRARTNAGEKFMNEAELLKRIVVNPGIFGGKPIIRGMRIGVEHVLGMLAAGETAASLLVEYPDLELEDVQACLIYAHRIIAHEKIELFVIKAGA